MLDTTYRIETPEGVAIHLKPAGPMVRSLAWLIDMGIRMVAYIALSIPLAFLGATGIGILLLLLFALEWFYPVFFEVYKKGQTPGKRVMKLQVLRDDGSPVGWAHSVLRNLLRFADFLPLFYGVGLIAMLFSRNFQRLGDIAAGTMVVYQDRASQSALSKTKVKAYALPLPLSLEEQRAVIAFAERLPQLSIHRACELGETVSVLTGQSGQEAVTRLHGFASWLMGTSE